MWHKKLYFILAVSHVNIFHLSLDSNDYFDTISKSQVTILTQYQKVNDQINTFEILKTKLTYNVKIEDQIYRLPISFG